MSAQIDDVRPVVSERRIPSKAVVGEVIPVTALVWREGHDAVSATLVVSGPDDTAIAAIPMHKDVFIEDRVHAVFTPDREGMWQFRIDAWLDPVETWRHAVRAKIAAGQNAIQMWNDLEVGAELFTRAKDTVPSDHHPLLESIIEDLRSGKTPAECVARALEPATTELLTRYPLREGVRRSSVYNVRVERRSALVNSWYELFPRSTGGWDEEGKPIHGTFKTTEGQLQRIADMGFDTVYFPPIHPVGKINRKGRNNTLIPDPEDVGSPWAIGSAEGGHDALNPLLGDEEDFKHLLDYAEELGLEIAIDLALQCAPDHPWATEHPEFFTTLPDGTIAFAENPPKKYQDIYPLNFTNDFPGIYQEIDRVVRHWIGLGIHTFRVDNPHTKPAEFWSRLITGIHWDHPEVIFLAEAFTRPARLYGLAKCGFSQSYSYFTWKNTKEELIEFGHEITELADYARPNLFVNTPDILHAFLVEGGKPAFAIRATLATTMSPLWGMYSGFELYENEPVVPGSEEYLNSEKYELRPRDFMGPLKRGESLEPYITMLNTIRREHPALQQLRCLHFHDTDSDQVLAYSKVDPTTGDSVLVVVNLDPHNIQETTVHLDLSALGLEGVENFPVHDVITGADWQWWADNYVRFDPHFNVAHILELPQVPEGLREQLAWRTVTDYRG